MNETELLNLAETLTRRSGKSTPISLERLTGGKNNRVYCVRLKGGEEVALKLYHTDPRDPRDRLGAEWSFLTYVQERNVEQVPTPLSCSRAQHAGLYTFIQGHKLKTEELDAHALAQASNFIAAVNAPPREVERLAPGSESCFSVNDHLQTVDRRVSYLSNLDQNAPFISEVEELISARLKPLWSTVRKAIVNSAQETNIVLKKPISTICISPSDFGFHNALIREDGHIAFIDFEYAGRDDPAKLICDFFCQPEVAVPLDHFDAFVDSLIAPLSLEGDDLWRCDALLPAYRIKWVCIILNEFLDIGSTRRSFAHKGCRRERAARQIDRAIHYLDLIKA